MQGFIQSYMEDSIERERERERERGGGREEERERGWGRSRVGVHENVLHIIPW